jgi:colicin import membrane protein
MSILDGTGLTPQTAGVSVDSQERGSLTDKSMWKELRNNPRALLYAVLMHLLLFLALILNLDWKTSHTGGEQSSVIKAQVVDSTKVQAEVNKVKQAEANKVHQEETRKNELKQAEQQAEQRLSEVKQKQVEEQKNLQKLQQQRVAQQKLEVDRQSKLKIQQAKLKKEQDAKAAQQHAAEEKKKTAAAEAKRKQDEAKQKAAEDKKRQQDDERAMQKQLDQEEGNRQKNDNKSGGPNQGDIDKYKAAIQQAVQNNWLQPPSAQSGLQCTVRVNLIPGGDVAGVRIVVSSGDAAFDRSVENAVRKAAPLPLPSDPGLFDNFRELTFVFKPEN